MAKKINKVFEATLKKNPEKGGAWMATITVGEDGVDTVDVMTTAAWANASAGKRWIKEQVQKLTPRKSVKMTACTTTPPDAKGKPMAFEGKLTYKA